MDEFFKTESQDSIDKKWLTQLCYDGGMDDEEIDEFVEAVISWGKNKSLPQIRTKEQILTEMIDVMPFLIPSGAHPYVLEAMEVYAFEFYRHKINSLSSAGAAVWVDISDRYPLCYQTGDFDGVKSDKLLVKDKSGDLFIASCYQYEGGEYSFYREDGFEWLVEPQKWNLLKIED